MAVAATSSTKNDLIVEPGTYSVTMQCNMPNQVMNSQKNSERNRRKGLETTHGRQSNSR